MQLGVKKIYGVARAGIQIGGVWAVSVIISKLVWRRGQAKELMVLSQAGTVRG